MKYYFSIPVKSIMKEGEQSIAQDLSRFFGIGTAYPAGEARYGIDTSATIFFMREPAIDIDINGEPTMGYCIEMPYNTQDSNTILKAFVITRDWEPFQLGNYGNQPGDNVPQI